MDRLVTVYQPLHQCIEVTPPLRVTVWVGSVKNSTLREHITQAPHFTNINFVHYQACQYSPSLFHGTISIYFHHLKHKLKFMLISASSDLEKKIVFFQILCCPPLDI